MLRDALVLGSTALVVLAPTAASAHFHIDYPNAKPYPGPSPVPWWNEDSVGSPQKLGPCGDEDDGTNQGNGPTHVVTTFSPGQAITLQWTEVISHTGWFRIAYAENRGNFVNPPVQINSNGTLADAGIETSPILPVLADGIYPHQGGSPKTWPPYQLTLPRTPCAHCTIQIIQVMLEHGSNLAALPDGSPNPDGFFYHHCIDISIAPGTPDALDAAAAEDAGASAVTDAAGATEETGATAVTGAAGGGTGAAGAGTGAAGAGAAGAGAAGAGAVGAGAAGAGAAVQDATTSTAVQDATTGSDAGELPAPAAGCACTFPAAPRNSSGIGALLGFALLFCRRSLRARVTGA